MTKDHPELQELVKFLAEAPQLHDGKQVVVAGQA